jgi:hypothetical protein
MYMKRAILALLFFCSIRIYADSKSEGYNSIIFIYREPALFKTASVTVSVGEVDIGTLKNGEYYKIIQPSGRITIKARRNDAEKSNAIELITQPATKYYLRILYNSHKGITIELIPGLFATSSIASCRLVSELQIAEQSEIVEKPVYREVGKKTGIRKKNEQIRKRGFEFQLCEGLLFESYQGELKAVIDQATSLGYSKGDGMDFLIEVGWAIAKDAYFAFTIDSFVTTYSIHWRGYFGWPLSWWGLWLPVGDSLELTNVLIGFGMNYYPFHKGLLIKGLIGVAIFEQSSFLLGDTSLAGIGTAIVVAYDLNPRIAALAFIVGLKGYFVLLPNNTISAVAPFIGISYR